MAMREREVPESGPGLIDDLDLSLDSPHSFVGHFRGKGRIAPQAQLQLVAAVYDRVPNAVLPLLSGERDEETMNVTIESLEPIEGENPEAAFLLSASVDGKDETILGMLGREGTLVIIQKGGRFFRDPLIGTSHTVEQIEFTQEATGRR